MITPKEIAALDIREIGSWRGLDGESGRFRVLRISQDMKVV